MLSSTTSLLSLSLLFTSLASAITHDCSHMRTEGIKFDFTKLTGPHSVSVIDKDRPPAVYNTTWTVDICKPLERKKEIEKENQCKSGTYVCGIETSYNPVSDPNKEHVQIDKVIPVSGDFHTSDGKGLEPLYTRLKSKDSNSEGLEVVLNGGTYDKKSQKTIIQFICDKERSGNEGSQNTESKLKERAEDGDDKDDEANSLSYVSYKSEDDFEVLRLKWRTKYACEDFIEEDGDSKGGWGFFTWLILLLFLGTAAYLIFGSWLNYNRYGARGWDLLPHGDTIRDIPYLFKDWSRKVVDTVSGGGSRGGYSAV